jgi:type I restriction enzyme S subunit
MKGQFFMNTGIQPSILFFENTGKPTSVVEFWDVIKGVNGVIEETMVLSVPREKFDASCSFDMRRYQEVKAVANPAGFPMVKLGDIAELCRNNTEIVDDANGMYTKYFGPKIVGKCSNYHFDGEYILTPGRQSIGLLGYVNGKFTTTHTFVIKVKPEYSSKYVYYYLLLNDKLSEKSKGIIPYIKNEDVLTLQVIVPPLETQKEIVATLDRIYAPGTTELAETLKLTDKAMDIVLANPGGASLEPIVEAQRLMRKSAQMVADVKAQMVADIKAQMVAVMKSVNMRGFEMKKLDEVCRFVGGKGNQDRSSEYTIPYYESNGIFGFVKDALYTGEYIITARCMSIGAVHYVNGAFYPSDHTINMTSIDVTKLNNRFLYYWLLMNNDILKAMSSGIKPGIRKSDVVEIKMPIPPIDFQLSVLKRMDDLESQHQVLITLGKKSEDNARFILDSYLNTA